MSGDGGETGDDLLRVLARPATAEVPRISGSRFVAHAAPATSEAAALADVVVVVTRWYGGTKLGRGGLVRAYGGAAAAVLEAAETTERTAMVTRTVHHPYELTAAVDGVLGAHGAIEVDAHYGATVTRTVAVPRADAECFASDLRDATAGQVGAD